MSFVYSVFSRIYFTEAKKRNSSAYLPRNSSAPENITRRLRKGLEGTQRNESRGGWKVGPADPTLGPVSALLCLMPTTFWSLPPTPPWKPSKVSLHRFLSQFDPTVHTWWRCGSLTWWFLALYSTSAYIMMPNAPPKRYSTPRCFIFST